MITLTFELRLKDSLGRTLQAESSHYQSVAEIFSGHPYYHVICECIDESTGRFEMRTTSSETIFGQHLFGVFSLILGSQEQPETTSGFHFNNVFVFAECRLLEISPPVSFEVVKSETFKAIGNWINWYKTRFDRIFAMEPFSVRLYLPGLENIPREKGTDCQHPTEQLEIRKAIYAYVDSYILACPICNTRLYGVFFCESDNSDIHSTIFDADWAKRI